MKYKCFYFLFFKRPMKKVLEEKYDKAYASEIIRKSKKVYRGLVENMDDIGKDNPMLFNELFALAFVSPYLASDKKIPPETIQEMMERSLYYIKWYFARTDLNTDKGKASNKKSIVKYSNGLQKKGKRNIQVHLKWTLLASPMKELVIIGLLVVLFALTQRSLELGN